MSVSQFLSRGSASTTMLVTIALAVLPVVGLAQNQAADGPLPPPANDNPAASAEAGLVQGGLPGMPQSYGPVYGAERSRPPAWRNQPPGFPGAAPGTGPLDPARQAFWDGDYSRSIRAYRALIGSRPDDPNVPGEMGNVYYAQGDWAQAALAYREAALRLIRQHRLGQANHLLTVVRGLDPQVASEIQQAIDSSRGSARPGSWGGN